MSVPDSPEAPAPALNCPGQLVVLASARSRLFSSRLLRCEWTLEFNIADGDDAPGTTAALYPLQLASLQKLRAPSITVMPQKVLSAICQEAQDIWRKASLPLSSRDGPNVASQPPSHPIRSGAHMYRDNH